jgi:peroxiredoxin
MMRTFLAFFLAFSSAFAAGELSNRRAPSFTLFDSAQKAHDILDYRGKVLIVDFIQVACPHCAKFSAVLEQIKAKFGPQVAVLSVVNPPSDMNGVKKYIAENKVTGPVLFDCGNVAFSYLMPKSGSVNVPHVFLVDREGMIRHDVGYAESLKDIFEGRGLFAEVEKLVNAKK